MPIWVDKHTPAQVYWRREAVLTAVSCDRAVNEAARNFLEVLFLLSKGRVGRVWVVRCVEKSVQARPDGAA